MIKMNEIKITCLKCLWVHKTLKKSLDEAERNGISCVRCNSTGFRMFEPDDLKEKVPIPVADDSKLEGIVNEDLLFRNET